MQRWRRELALARGDMERMAGRHAESEDAFSEALLLAREEGVTEDAGHALAGRGLAALALGRSVEATQLLREATGNLGEGHRVWADAMHGLAWQALEAGELTVARTRWERVNAVARATTQLRAELESDLGLTMIVWAQGGDPVALLQDVSSRARDAGLNDLATRALMADAEVRMERGDAAGALRIAQVLDEVGDRSGFPLADGGARAIRAAALQLAGESDRAREAADEAVATMRLHQSRWLSVWAWSCRVIAATGSAPQGLAELGDRPFAPEPPWPAEPTRLAVQALLMAERNPREAVERARDALRGLSTAPFPGAARRVATDAAQALYRAGEAAEASRVLDEIERTGRRLAQIEQIRRMTES